MTICSYRRIPLFGDIVDDATHANGAGLAVQQCWLALPRHYPHVDLDAFVLMPNHVHGILVLLDDAISPPDEDVRNPNGRSPLSEVIRAFKTFSARQINEARATLGSPVWQRNYWERVIRDEAELNRIRSYIDQNPARWRQDPDILAGGEATDAAG